MSAREITPCRSGSDRFDDATRRSSGDDVCQAEPGTGTKLPEVVGGALPTAEHNQHVQVHELRWVMLVSCSENVLNQKELATIVGGGPAGPDDRGRRGFVPVVDDAFGVR